MGNSKKLFVAILIVEDEPLIRMGVVSQLEDAGFLIYEAGNADEAICRLENMRKSASSSRISTCLAPWMGSNWPIMRGAVGLR
jgi:hypothetical protein